MDIPLMLSICKVEKNRGRIYCARVLEMLFISNWFLISQTRSRQKEGEVRGLTILP